jgi:hypothetical protein
MNTVTLDGRGRLQLRTRREPARHSLGPAAACLAVCLIAAPSWGQTTAENGSTIAAGGTTGGDSDSGSAGGGLLLNNGCVGDGSGWSVSGTNGPFGGFAQFQRFTVAEPGWNINAIGIEGHLTVNPTGSGLLGRVWPDDGSGTGPDETGTPFTTTVYFLASDPFSCENWQDETKSICLAPGNYWFHHADNNDADYIASAKNGTSGGPAFSRRNVDLAEFPHGPLALRIFGSEDACDSCFTVLDEEIVCHADGETFTYTVEGIDACTGGVSAYTFTSSGGAVGEELCFTLLVGENGSCCTTELCVVIPDCTPPDEGGCPADLDNDSTVSIGDFLIVLAAWNGPSGDVNGDGTTDIVDLLTVLSNWGDCPP